MPIPTYFIEALNINGLFFLGCTKKVFLIYIFNIEKRDYNGGKPSPIELQLQVKSSPCDQALYIATILKSFMGFDNYFLNVDGLKAGKYCKQLSI